MHRVNPPDLDRINNSLELARPIQEIYGLFPSRLDALSYYADYRNRHQSQDVGVCFGCGSRDAKILQNYVWVAEVNTRSTILKSFFITSLILVLGMIHSSTIEVRFSTRHGFCRQCARIAGLKRMIADLLHHVLFALLLVYLFAAISFVVFGSVMLFEDPEMGLRVLLFFPAVLLVLVLLVGGFRFCRRLRIPASLKSVGQAPFKVAEVQTLRTW